MKHKQYPKFKQYLARTDKPYLKYEFPGVELIDRNYSQAFQDLFVISVLNGKRNGYYLDIGCSSPILINNSFLLEHYFGWNGLAFDLDELAVKQHKNVRKHNCYLTNALNIDFDETLANSPKQIDYVQIDVCVNDDSSNNLVVLNNLLKTNHRFSVIHYETNVYQVGRNVQEEGFAKLTSHGYMRIAKDVMFYGEIFEDWYVDPLAVNMDIANIYRSDGLECTDVLFKW